MVEPHHEPAALAWKLLVRLPFGLKNRLALALGGRPFYPGEDDYCFVRRRVCTARTRWWPWRASSVTPLFSAIIPTYNRAAFVARAIESALDQQLARRRPRSK